VPRKIPTPIWKRRAVLWPEPPRTPPLLTIELRPYYAHQRPVALCPVVRPLQRLQVGHRVGATVRHRDDVIDLPAVLAGVAVLAPIDWSVAGVLAPDARVDHYAEEVRTKRHQYARCDDRALRGKARFTLPHSTTTTLRLTGPAQPDISTLLGSGHLYFALTMPAPHHRNAHRPVHSAPRWPRSSACRAPHRRVDRRVRLM